MSTMADALSEDHSGTILSIEVSPGAKSALFPAGYNEWRKAIGCRVASPAVDGKANKAVIRLISTTIGVPALCSFHSLRPHLVPEKSENFRYHQGAACGTAVLRKCRKMIREIPSGYKRPTVFIRNRAKKGVRTNLSFK